MDVDRNTVVIIAVAAGAAWAYHSWAKTPPPGTEVAVLGPAGPTGPAGHVLITSALNAALPRGIRNNNPGNVKYSKANSWVGQRGFDSGGFVVFDTSGHGLRAAGKLIKTYINRYGLNTLLKISKRWSPDAIGLSGQYAAGVSKYSGVPAEKALSATDNATLSAILRGMVAQENGAAYLNRYPLADIKAIITAA